MSFLEMRGLDIIHGFLISQCSKAVSTGCGMNAYLIIRKTSTCICLCIEVCALHIESRRRDQDHIVSACW